MTGTSPLELLHPSGGVQRVLLLGGRCPPPLVPPNATRASADVDLALIAPSPDDLRRPAWLERAASDAAGALAEHGLAYALLPRGLRGRARRELRRAGLVLEAPSVILPEAAHPRYLLPLRSRPWRYAVGRLIAARPRVRQGLRTAQALPFGKPLLAAALPAVGVVGRPAGADALAAWVARLGAGTRTTSDVVVATSWRGPAGPAVVHCLAPGEVDPWGVAKVAGDSAREADRLERLGGAAERAGARVPRLLATGRLPAAAVVVETPVAGRPVADVLRRSPQRFAELATTIAAWLEQWNRATAIIGPVPPRQLEEEILAPATALAPLLPQGRHYRDWLAARCSALAGRELALVAAHHDLTMWNVVLDQRGKVGVLDWAQAEETGLPLTDFFYAVADAAGACDAPASRLDAVRSCFANGGRRAASVAAMQERLVTRLAVTPDAVELCLHACWLRHAANEQRARPASDGPILEVVRWLAQRSVGAQT